MTSSAAVVLILLILGNALVEVIVVPIPGSALALVVLAGIFMIRGGPDRGSSELFDFLAPYFPLFFVPAAVGVVANFDTLSLVLTHVLIAIVAGTTATVIVTGLVTQALLRIASREASA